MHRMQVHYSRNPILSLPIAGRSDICHQADGGTIRSGSVKRAGKEIVHSLSSTIDTREAPVKHRPGKERARTLSPSVERMNSPFKRRLRKEKVDSPIEVSSGRVDSRLLSETMNLSGGREDSYCRGSAVSESKSNVRGRPDVREKTSSQGRRSSKASSSSSEEFEAAVVNY